MCVVPRLQDEALQTRATLRNNQHNTILHQVAYKHRLKVQETAPLLATRYDAHLYVPHLPLIFCACARLSLCSLALVSTPLLTGLAQNGLLLVGRQEQSLATFWTAHIGVR
jgi:hypothetical protein